MKYPQPALSEEIALSTDSIQNPTGILQGQTAAESKPLKLVVQLCDALAQENIVYCHWKSNNALDRSANGENDLDLLVARADVSRFVAIVSRLGFKQARLEAQKQMIGILDYYGYDEETGKLIHLHAHYQLVMGHDMTKNFRLPIEDAYLQSAKLEGLFKVPAPEYEYIVLVFRVILKHSTWDVILGRDGKLRTGEIRELEYLRARIDQQKIEVIFKTHLPYIGMQLFDQCLQSLKPSCSLASRVRTAQRLQVSLEAGSRLPLGEDVFQKHKRFWVGLFRKRIFKYRSRRRLESGGFMVSIVGGDGAGKTTAVQKLTSWLSRNFDIQTVHLGKPRESLLTVIVRAFLRIGSLLHLYPHLNSMSIFVPNRRHYPFSGKTPWMIREACKARDRYRAYLKARKFVNNGGIIISDRFPLPQITLMDAPVVEKVAAGSTDFLSRALIKFERKYYQRMVLPELVIILKLDPEEAVRRKVEEDSSQVRARSTEIWQMQWDGASVHVVDAQQSPEQVISCVKSLVWSKL